MSRTQTPLGQEAMAVLTLASAAEQSELPYVHETVGGQQAGHGMSGFGGTSGQGGLGWAFPAVCQAPFVHRARRVPHCPKSHVVPSGSRQMLPFGGSDDGHSARGTVPLSSPPSGPSVIAGVSSAHAPASAADADPITSAAASWASGATREEELTTARIERFAQAC
jgi:hypothetical protein